MCRLQPHLLSRISESCRLRHRLHARAPVHRRHRGGILDFCRPLRPHPSLQQSTCLCHSCSEHSTTMMSSSTMQRRFRSCCMTLITRSPLLSSNNILHNSNSSNFNSHLLHTSQHTNLNTRANSYHFQPAPHFAFSTSIHSCHSLCHRS